MAGPVLHRHPETRKTDAVHYLRPPVSSLPPQLRRSGADGRRGRAVAGLALGLLAALILAACATEHRERARFMARLSPPQPVLTGTMTYGNGVVAVQSWLGPSVRLRAAGEKPSAGSDRRGGHAVGTARPFSEGGNAFSRDEIDEMYGRVDYQYVRPPRLALTFTFTNTSAAPVTFTIANVDSALGNYAARPEKFTLAPGEQASPDPMLSPVENNFELLDVTLSLKLGAARETHVLPLRQAAAPPPPAAPRAD